MNAKPLIIVGLIAISAISCNKDDNNGISLDPDSTVVDVEESYFTSGVTMSKVPCTLSDGSETKCWEFTTSSTPDDHNMGPWCPENISDDASQGGIWLEDGQVYDVDGAFIQNLATFYNDNTWMMYNSSTGEITKTSTQTECEDAANPNVGAEYENYCVECLPAYITNLSQTWLIPVTPVLQDISVYFATAGGPPGQSTVPSTRGIALNGVEFSAPAPVNNILSAYTLAPFDDAGGHINVHQGYHYHAATGMSTKVVQSDGHTALIGYALDGHGIYEYDASATDLDDLLGHYDDVRGYHYHVDFAGNNNFINGLKGAYAIQ